MIQVDLHNPVTRAELKHQRWVIDTYRSGRVWIMLALLLVVPGLLISLFYFGAALLSPLAPDTRTAFAPFTLTFGLLITVNISLYMVVTLVTLSLASRSIGREKDGQTWEPLLLTAMTPQQIVLGKWWASTRMLLGDHVMIAIARLGVLGWALWALTERATLPPGPGGLPAELFLLPLLAVVTFAYAALDMAFTTALGVFSAVFQRGGLITTLAVLALRGAVISGAVALWVFTSLLLVVHSNGLWLAYTLAAFAVYVLLIWALLAAARAGVVHHARIG